MFELAEGALESGLRALGYAEFRPGQRDAIETLLRDGRLLLVAPTGGGKSLTYQLPATLLPGTTLVVSPLIALMADQVHALHARGVKATYVASTLEPNETRRRLAEIGAGAYQIAYVAPERLAVPSFRRLLSSMKCPLLAIDEAHCISEWGHDFRPEYLQLAALLSELQPERVLACTATATPVVRDEILSRLGLPASTAQHVHGFARPNLALRAVEIERSKDARKLVDALLEEAIGFGTDSRRGAAIIYAPTRRKTEDEAARLRDGAGSAGRIGVYHAGLPPGDREHAQRRFSAGEIDVMVATNAFGMGIDRADVRAVVHLAPPSSIEAYYQEVGRAGRDGEPAFGLLLASSSDLPLRRRLLERGNGDGIAPSPHVVEHKWSLFLELMRWVEGGSCRHDAILRYFGDEQEALHGCGRCDVCTAIDDNDAVDAEQVSVIVRKALSGVARVHGRFGLTMASKLLRGIEDERLIQHGLHAVRTFGVLRDWSDDRVMRLLRRCVSAGWVSFVGDDRPMVVLTEEGVRTMRGERPARLLLPPVQARRSVRREKPAVGTRVGGGREPVVMRDGDEVLFEALRRHRMQLAREQGVAPFMIASDRTLREMCALRPRTHGELLDVHGIGPAKAERYGDGFIQVLWTGSA